MQAQPSVAATSQPDIVQRIEQQSNGEVEIDIPDDILKELLEDQSVRQPGSQQGTTRPGGQSTRKERVTNRGYRIQIFGDGRNQATLKSRATARANAVCARFPKYRGQVYSFSKSPNWYVRLGNFKTQAEASQALIQLKRAFPAFASEMRIVKSAIVPTR